MLTPSTSRRGLIAGLASVAAMAPTSAARADVQADPVMLLAAKIQKAHARAEASSVRVKAIAESQPLPVDGLPRIDAAVPALADLARAHGKEISRHDLENRSFFQKPADAAARLQWWDGEMAAIKRRAVECGFRAAADENEDHCAELSRLEEKLGQTSATTLEGVLVRLRYAAADLYDDEPEAGYYSTERALLGAIDDLERIVL